MLGFNWKLSKEGKKRFFDEFMPLLHDTKHEVLSKDEERSWYLVYIGTKAGSRGKGYAKALIEDTTKQVSCLSTMSLKQEASPASMPRKSIEPFH
jgi:ribosomal protein S18 acetylase RimI-like enzyme